MERSRAVDSASKRIFVVARYRFYLDDAIEAFQAIGLRISVSDNLESLRKEIFANPANAIVFVPHYSKVIDIREYSGIRMIGFHTGDLPHNRGGSPLQNKILQSEYQTKVSAIVLEQIVDTGAVYTYRLIDLSHGTVEQMLHRISKLIAEMMVEIATSEIIPISQSGLFQSAKRLAKNDSELPSEANAKDLYDRIRMVDGLDYPRAFIRRHNYTVYLEDAQLLNNKLTARAIFEFGQQDDV
jgi:methionyl-tRNA formyltransferase